MRRSFFLMCYTNYSLFWMEAVNDEVFEVRTVFSQMDQT